MQVELYGGSNSAINIRNNASSSFAYRDTKFTFQLYARNATGTRFPQDGFTFVDGNILCRCES